MGWGLLQELNFEHVKFEMQISHPAVHPKWMGGYRSLNLSEVVRARDESLESIISIKRVFKALGIDNLRRRWKMRRGTDIFVSLVLTSFSHFLEPHIKLPYIKPTCPIMTP